MTFDSRWEKLEKLQTSDEGLSELTSKDNCA